MSRNRSIKFNVSLLFILMIFSFATLVIGYNYIQSTKNSYNLSDRIIEKTTKSAIDKTNYYIHKMDTNLKILAKTTMTNNIFDNKENSLSIMKELILSEKHLASAFIADEEGRFLQVRQDPKLAYREIDRIGKNRVQYTEYKDKDLKTTKITTKTTAYDPRVRGWYVNSFEDEITVSKPYIYASTNKVGITISFCNYDEFGNKLVVSAVDITLESLTKFLKDEASIIGGEIYLVDNRSNLITSSYSKINEETLAKKDKIDKSDFAYFKILEESKKENASNNVDFRGDSYIYKKTSFVVDSTKEWSIIVAIPEDLILGESKKTLYTTLTISIILLLVFIVIASKISQIISDPIIKLSRDINALKELKTDIFIENKSNIKEIYNAQNSLISLKQGLKSFKKYMPSDLVKILIEKNIEAKIGGDEKELTIMFTDIEGFTTISENLAPKELTKQLAIYFEELEVIISKYDGTIDKYIGDAIMAFWGAPLEIKDPSLNALKCAIEMQERLEVLNAKWREEGKAELRTRIGIHQGKTLVGNIGSNKRMNYTIIGDSVNVAARLEGINKTYGTSIMVSDRVKELLDSQFEFKFVDDIELKGKKKATKIYTVS